MDGYSRAGVRCEKLVTVQYKERSVVRSVVQCSLRQAAAGAGGKQNQDPRCATCTAGENENRPQLPGPFELSRAIVQGQNSSAVESGPLDVRELLRVQRLTQVRQWWLAKNIRRGRHHVVQRLAWLQVSTHWTLVSGRFHALHSDRDY
jgi:hypothetical protein